MIEQSFKQVVGARYVPKFYQNSQDPSSSEWEAGKMYEPLTNVTFNMNGYCSKKPVPMSVGNPADNPEYWAKTFDYNAAYAGLQDEIDTIRNGGLNDNVIEYSKLTNDLKKTITDNTICVFVKNGVSSDPAIANGACAIFKSRVNKKVIMFDSGRADDYSNVVATLEANDITHIDYFILTHMHADHYGNIPALFSASYMNGDTIAYMPRGAEWLDDWDTRLATYSAYFSHVVTISSDNPLIVDDIKLDFINCDEADYDYYHTEGYTQFNTYSVGAYVDIDGTTLMMCGDMDAYSQNHIIEEGKMKFANIVNAPHHGIEQDTPLYQRVRPEYIIAQMGIAPEYTHNNYDVGHMYNNAMSTYRANALGIPFYITAYGDIYVGFLHHNYSVIPSGKNIFTYMSVSDDKSEYNVYVDDTYTGENLGTQDAPFNTIKEALAFVEHLDALFANIIVVGTYNHPTEGITYEGKTFLHIKSADNTQSITLARAIFRNSRVTVDYVHFTTADANSAVLVNGGFVMIRHCLIDGTTTSQSSAYDGAAITATSGGIARITNSSEISNRRCIAYVEQGGSVLIQGCSGSGNSLWFCVSDANLIICNTNTITANGFLGRRSSGMVNTIVSDTYSYSDGKPFTLFSGTYTTDTMETVPISTSVFNGKFFIIYGGDGSIHKFYKKSNGHFSTIDEVFAATNSDDPNFAIAIVDNNLQVTSRTHFKVVVI